MWAFYLSYIPITASLVYYLHYQLIAYTFFVETGNMLLGFCFLYGCVKPIPPQSKCEAFCIQFGIQLLMQFTNMVFCYGWIWSMIYGMKIYEASSMYLLIILLVWLL